VLVLGNAVLDMIINEGFVRRSACQKYNQHKGLVLFVLLLHIPDSNLRWSIVGGMRIFAIIIRRCMVLSRYEGTSSYIFVRSQLHRSILNGVHMYLLGHNRFHYVLGHGSGGI